MGLGGYGVRVWVDWKRWKGCEQNSGSALFFCVNTGVFFFGIFPSFISAPSTEFTRPFAGMGRVRIQSAVGCDGGNTRYKIHWSPCRRTVGGGESHNTLHIRIQKNIGQNPLFPWPYLEEKAPLPNSVPSCSVGAGL